LKKAITTIYIEKINQKTILILNKKEKVFPSNMKTGKS